MKKMKLDKIATRAPGNWDKIATKEKLAGILEELDVLQNLLYAERKHSLLVILQGMDASGKDGLINDVFTSMNPQGIQVASFKEPTQDELAHDFLWRIHHHAPAKGMIQVFNRSQYEDVLVTRVEGMIDDSEAKKRMQAINNFEKLLTDNNTHILKFYLHVSEEKQLSRIQDRMKVPEKMWKYNAGDEAVVGKRTAYLEAYEDIFDNCNDVPWHIIPADQNWYKSFLVADRIRDTLRGLDMKYPELTSTIDS